MPLSYPSNISKGTLTPEKGFSSGGSTGVTKNDGIIKPPSLETGGYNPIKTAHPETNPYPTINEPTKTPDATQPQPIPPTGNCMIGAHGLALGETPISIQTSIAEHFNQMFSPPLKIAQTDGLHRTEAAKRMSQAYGANVVFVDTGVLLLDKCRLNELNKHEVPIPFTNSIIFISFYFPEYDDFLYVGEDLRLYRAERKHFEHVPDDPEIPTLGSGTWLTRIDQSDVIPDQVHTETYGLWSESIGNLLNFHTGSVSQTEDTYRLPIHNYPIGECKSELQFNIGYGHRLGSGSFDFGGYDYLTPSKAIYGQYASLCLDDPKAGFKINGSTIDSIYVIQMRSAKMRDKIDVGNWEMNLAHLSGSQWFAQSADPDGYIGSQITLKGTNEVLRIIDDSRINSASYYSGGPVYKVVSGSIEQGVFNASRVYGYVYPTVGAIVLDSSKLDADANFLTSTGTEVTASNPLQIFTAMSGAAMLTDVSGDRLGFAARSKRDIHTNTYYIRVKNGEYNFSNNPTFIIDNEGTINSDFRPDPIVYINSIGMYSPRRELLATCKLSRPIQKSHVEEALFIVNLEYK